jgi:hypothetical protein
MDILITTLHTSLVELEFGDTPFFVLENIGDVLVESF